MQAVPKVQTPLGELEIAAVLRDSHHAVAGTFPTPERLGGAWAQIAEENGRGDAIWCWNFGNVTVPKIYAGDFYVIHVQERVGPPATPGGPPTWVWKDLKFQAHATALDGAAAWWSLMLTRYHAAIERFDAGDPVGAAKALAAAGYFTVESALYERALRLLYAEFRAKVLPKL